MKAFQPLKRVDELSSKQTPRRAVDAVGDAVNSLSEQNIQNIPVHGKNIGNVTTQQHANNYNPIDNISYIMFVLLLQH